MAKEKIRYELTLTAVVERGDGEHISTFLDTINVNSFQFAEDWAKDYWGLLRIKVRLFEAGRNQPEGG